MSYLSDPSQHPALTEDPQIGHWSNRVGRIMWRQGSRLMQIGRVDRRMARLAANGPNRLWRRMARLGDRIEAILDDHGRGAARLSRLQAEGLHLQAEAVLRTEYDRLGALLARIAQIDAHVAALEARIARRRMGATIRRDLRAALTAHKTLLTETSRALRLLHVEVSAHLVEFR